MENGLKQGCPLSPILYNLAMDPLLFAMARQAFPAGLPPTQQWGYADDLAVGCPDLRSLALALPHVDDFNRASGSSSSKTKSFLISTVETTREALAQALPTQWCFVTPAMSSMYLGIRIGRQVTAGDVFEKAVKSLEARVIQYRPLQGLYKLQQRIIVANSFLSPMLSFIQRFFLMPAPLRCQVQSILGGWVLKGRLLSWDQCCLPAQAGGLAQPLRDPTNCNISSLLCRRDLPRTGGNPRSMRIGAHISRGLALFQKFCSVSPPADAPLCDVLALILKHHKPCFSNLVRKYVSKRVDPDTAAKWTNAIQENAARLPHHTPHFLRAHLLRTIFNAVPTRQRLRHLPDSPSDPLCRICGSAVESLEHLHTECRATRNAITTIATLNSDTAVAFAQIHPKDFYLQEPLDKSRICQIVALSHAVWAACRSCDTKAPTEQRLKTATKLIFSNFDNTLKALTRIPKAHSRKRDVEHREFLSLLRSLDQSATYYFTDGSSLGNPGPAGAGVAVFRNDMCIFSQCISLGIASNNVAELEGLSAACDHALLSLADPSHTTNVFFCDNRYALSMADGKWKAKSNRHVINQVADKVKTLRRGSAVLLLWVPGHAGIRQNELSDRLAKLGATGLSMQWAGSPPSSPVDRPRRCPATSISFPPSSTSQSILSTAAVTPPQLRRSSRTRRPAASLFPGIDWQGVAPLPPSPIQPAAHHTDQPLAKICPHGFPFPSSTLLPVCCTQLSDESSPDPDPESGLAEMLLDNLYLSPRSSQAPHSFSPFLCEPPTPNKTNSPATRPPLPRGPTHLSFKEL